MNLDLAPACSALLNELLPYLKPGAVVTALIGGWRVFILWRRRQAINVLGDYLQSIPRMAVHSSGKPTPSEKAAAAAVIVDALKRLGHIKPAHEKRMRSEIDVPSSGKVTAVQIEALGGGFDTAQASLRMRLMRLHAYLQVLFDERL